MKNWNLLHANHDLIRRVVTGLALFCLAGSVVTAENAAPAVPSAITGNQTMTQKLDSIILPELAFENTPLKDAVATLMKRSAELDPDKKGVSLMLVTDAAKIEDEKITLKLTNVTLKDAVNALCQTAGLESKISPFALILKKK